MELSFQLGLHQKDRAILEQIERYFGVGKISKQGSTSVQYRVLSKKDLVSVIKHFDSYPLRTKKQADYLLFKQAFYLILKAEHLTEDGLQKIVAIKAAMNRGLSEDLQIAFPSVTPVSRPLIKEQIIPDPQ